MRIIFQPPAEDELKKAKEDYKTVGMDVGLAFAKEADRILAQISRFPHSGAQRFGFRRCIFLGFPYAIFYEILSDHLSVIAVSHTSRRPGYWKSRVAKK